MKERPTKLQLLPSWIKTTPKKMFTARAQARQATELIVATVIDYLFQEAWYDAKIREEWRRRDAQVKKL